MDINHRPTQIPLGVPRMRMNNWILMYAVGIYVGVLVAVLLCSILRVPDVLLVGILIGVLILAAAVMVLSFCVYMDIDPQRIVVRIGKVVLKTIPASDIKWMCVVSHTGRRNICLSPWPLETLAAQRELRLQKGAFTKDELIFRKRRGDWQKEFAKEQLLKEKSRYRLLGRRAGMLWLDFDPVVVVLLRRQFPDVPYLDLHESFGENARPEKANMIPFAFPYQAKFIPEGIQIVKGTQQIGLIPGESIQTAMRVERFVPHAKVEPVYGKYLVVSTLSVNELAARGYKIQGNRWKKRLISSLDHAEERMAVEYCAERLIWWDSGNMSCCALYDTPEKEQQIKQLCPHAQWLDFTDDWR